MNMTSTKLLSITVLSVVVLAGCGKSPAPKETPAEAKGKTATASTEKPAPNGEKPGGHDEKGGLKLSEAETSQAGIKTVKLAEEVVRTGIAVTATIQPNRDRFARVAPRVPGRILDVPGKLGDVVKTGQILASLDSVELGETTSAHQQASSQFNVAKADFDRSQRLYDEQVIPQKEYLRARAEFEKARAAFTTSGDKLRMMGVGPDATGSRLPVTAPFAGTVIEKTAVMGELAQPDKPLFTVADLSTVWIEANLYERDLPRIHVGSAADVSVAPYPDQRFRGRLAYISAVVDRDSRTVKGRIEVPNPDGRLKPEMFATAVIETREGVQALSVPAGAVVLVENRNTVFVKDPDGFGPRPVELGERIGDRQILKGGVAAGDEVVVSGTYELKSRLLKSQLGEGHGH